MSVEAWVIKFPDGYFHYWTWGDHKSDIIEGFELEQDKEWAELKKEGYRAVRVRITEMEEK